MKQTLDCTLYYSMVGERFNIYDRNTDPNLVKTKALIEIYSGEQQPALPDAYEQEAEDTEELTRLNILHDIKGGPFFSCDTQCIIVNGKNQILKLGDRYRLDVKMYRNLSDPSLFSMIFKEKAFHAQPSWISF